MKKKKKTRRARNVMKANDTTAVACIGKLLLIDNSIPLYQMSNQETTTRWCDWRCRWGCKKDLIQCHAFKSRSCHTRWLYGEEKEIQYAAKRTWDMNSLGLHRLKKENESMRKTFAEQSKSGRWKGENQLSHLNRASLEKDKRSIDLQKPIWYDQELMEYNIQ